eukprot:gnl/TRDRNA2_/TRDRNA2_83541_c0_seq1.p1 gnl/TRDRNA2_/TRDRNA2_83541_c0~~gnl/TRDRNA2_/TRDRNA2_83541_c0_seq1.p1  ORF type:complete len:224 (+),score=80.62 gnl/TRDRNA2_/TRDRNA2_83541_c0_seq1:112-783(+)
MKRLFGTAKAPPPSGPPPSLSDASAKMDSRLEAIDAKIAKCDEEMKRYLAPGRGAGAAAQQRKQMAVQCLKRKKMYEQQRDQLVGTQFNVDNLAFAQEQAEVTVMSVEAMKAGHVTLKEQYAKVNIDDIEGLMDDMADLQEEVNEINEALARNFAVPDGFDEAACEEEFAALEEEMRLEALGMGTAPSRPAYLPAAPAAAATPSSAEAASGDAALPAEVRVRS